MSVGAMEVRPLKLLVVGVLFTAGCSAGAGNNGASDGEGRECLQEVAGAGDLEVTDEAFNVINTDDSGDYKVTYAVEVTNNSSSDTAMVAGLRVDFIDEDGEPVTSSEGGAATGNVGQVEYVAPSERQYFAGTFTGGFKEPPADMTITLPHPVMEEDRKNEDTYWRPEKDVEYPHNLEASDITLKDDTEGGKKLRFNVDNDSNEVFESVEVITILRDDEKNLLGGQYSGPSSANSLYDLEASPGKNEVRINRPFPDGLPADTDSSNTEVFLTNSPDWTEVDEDCRFAFDPRR